MIRFSSGFVSKRSLWLIKLWSVSLWSLMIDGWLFVSSSLLQLSVELNPGSPSAPPGGDLLHVRAVGGNDTLHFLFCSQGAPTLLLVHTNSSSSTVKVRFHLSFHVTTKLNENLKSQQHDSAQRRLFSGKMFIMNLSVLETFSIFYGINTRFLAHLYGNRCFVLYLNDPAFRCFSDRSF